MNTACYVCNKELESAQEIESGACFDHLSQDSTFEAGDTISPLDFNSEAYLGVTDSFDNEIDTDDGC